jgi:CBS domain-containing protein
MFELTRDYNAILPLMLATVLATLVASALMRDSIMTEKLTRRGLRVPSDYHADILATTPVAAVMTPEVETIGITASAGDAARRFQANGHGAYPVLDEDGRCVAVISRSDLLRDDNLTPDKPLREVVAGDVVSVRSSDPLSEALEKMLAEEIRHLPVIDGNRLVGMCTRGDVMRARESLRAREQLEPGWRSRRVPSGPSTNGNTGQDDG